MVYVGVRAVELPDGLTGLEEVLLDEGHKLLLRREHVSPLHPSVAHSLLTSSAYSQRSLTGSS